MKRFKCFLPLVFPLRGNGELMELNTGRRPWAADTLENQWCHLWVPREIRKWGTTCSLGMKRKILSCPETMALEQRQGECVCLRQPGPVTVHCGRKGFTEPWLGVGDKTQSQEMTIGGQAISREKWSFLPAGYCSEPQKAPCRCLDLSWKPPSCWLTFRAPEGSMQASGSELEVSFLLVTVQSSRRFHTDFCHQWSCPAVTFKLQHQPSRQDKPAYAIAAQLCVE